MKAVRSVAPNATVFACASRANAVAELYEAGATYVYMPSVETANGVCEAAEATLGALLSDYRAKRDASCGPLEERQDVQGMAS